MCEFCMKHGAGRKWYLQARNYSADLVRNSRRFRDAMHWLLRGEAEGVGVAKRRLWLVDVPIVGWAVKRLVTMRMKPIHFGQVLTIDDVEKVFGLADEINLFPCVCRKHMVGKNDERYCFGLGSYPRELLDDQPDSGSEGERLTVEEAMELARDFERRGLIHTIWTLDTPFIIGVCSCRPGECLGLAYTLAGARMMFRGEHIFQVDTEKCTGCGACDERCFFGALTPAPKGSPRRIDPAVCHGCGLCASNCPVGAISLAGHNAPTPTETHALCAANHEE